MPNSHKSSAISPPVSAVSRLESAIADGSVEIFDGSFTMTRADGSVEVYKGRDDFHAPVKVASRDLAAQNELTDYVKSLGSLSATEDGLKELSRICTPLAPKSNAELAWDLELMETRMRVLNQAYEAKLARQANDYRALMLRDMSGEPVKTSLAQQYELDNLKAEVKQLKGSIRALLELDNDKGSGTRGDSGKHQSEISSARAPGKARNRETKRKPATQRLDR